MASLLRQTLPAAFLLVAAGLVGCGKSRPLPAPAAPLPAPVERLPGKWRGEMIVYEEQLQGKLPPEKIAELAAMKMDFEFRSDGTMALAGVDQGRAYTTQGRWEMVKQEGDLLTIKSIEQGGQPKDINLEFDGTDTFFIPLQTEVAELGAMRFTRIR